MASLATKQIIACGIGILFAFVYGVWTMMLTGGGHGNFIWFILFLTAGLLGSYYPVMAFLAVNLRPFLAKLIAGLLIAFNLVVSLSFIIDWVTEVGEAGPTDFERMWKLGVGWVLFAAFAHFLPTIIFLFLLIRSIVFGSSFADDDRPLSLDLN